MDVSLFMSGLGILIMMGLAFFVLIFILIHFLVKADAERRKIKSVFLISPVRKVTQENMDVVITAVKNGTIDLLEDKEIRDFLLKIEHYVKALEALGIKVHWPIRDTNQYDSRGLRICQDNRRAIEEANAILVWWDPSSMGSKFDFGIEFGLYKPTFLSNIKEISSTPTKSFENVLLDLHQEASEEFPDFVENILTRVN